VAETIVIAWSDGFMPGPKMQVFDSRAIVGASWRSTC